MKLFTSILLLALAFGANAQTGTAPSLQGTKVTFLGLDFTQAHFVGNVGFTNPDEIQNRILEEWNSVLMIEDEKYNLMGPLKLLKENSETNTAALMALNKSVSVKDIISNEAPEVLTADEIRKSVSKYNVKEKEGIGVSYVVETFNKLKTEARIWVTFIDLATGKVISTELYVGKPAGIGFRNYWLGAVTDVHDQLKRKYKKS